MCGITRAAEVLSAPLFCTNERRNTLCRRDVAVFGEEVDIDKVVHRVGPNPFPYHPLQKPHRYDKDSLFRVDVDVDQF